MRLNQIKLSCVFSFIFTLSLVLIMQQKAQAGGAPITPLCTVLDGQTVSQTSKNGSSLAVDNYTFVAINASGSDRTIDIQYDDDNGTRIHITANGAAGEALVAGATKTYTFSPPADVASRTYMDFDTGGHADTMFDVTCSDTPAVAPARVQNSTTKEVVASAMRSQVNVIQQNIGSRVSTIGNRAPSSRPSNVPSGTNNQRNYSSFGDDDYSYGSNGSNAIRSLAMMASFDSSLFAGNGFGGALALGPGDQGDDRAAQARSISGASPVTLWGHGSYSNFDNDYVSGAADNRYNGDIWGYNIGADYMFSNALTAGLSLGYNDTDVSTTFNSGTYEEKGWMVSPYAIYSPMENVTFIAEAGYGWGDIDVSKNNNATRASTTSDMWYGAINAAYAIHPVEGEPLSVTSSLALIASRKNIDSYADSDGVVVGSSHSNTRQAKPMIEAAYDVSTDGALVVTPFIKTGMIYNFIDALNGDKAAFSIGGGVRLSDDDLGLNAALEGSYIAGRKDYSEYTLSGTVTYGVSLVDETGKSYGIMKPFLSSNLNEYGRQHFRSGLSFANDRFSSSIALEHSLSMMDEYEASNSSRVYLSASMPF